jgi:predicted permease
MKTLLQDIKFGLRMMRRSPGFTAVAVLVLMLGIGGTSAMFTIINTLVWRPIQAKNPEQLVRIYSKDKKPGGWYRSFSYPNFVELREKNSAFTDIAAFNVCMAGINEGALTRRTFAGLISANYFATFGVRLPKGRVFLPEEEKPGSAIPAVIVSYNHWRKTGSDPSLVGKTVKINSRAFTVVGITPEDFTGTSAMFSPEFLLPLGMYEAVVNDFMNESKRQLADRQNHALMLVARLKPDLTMAAAQAQLQPLAARLEEAFPEANKDQILELGRLARLSMSTNPQTDSNQTISLLLIGLSAAVLLIACFNLANMLLARSASRRREIAIRLALGAGRLRLVRQLLTEGFLLAILGGAGGLLLAAWINQIMVNSFIPKLPFMDIVFNPRPDWRILATTFGACLFSVLIFGLVPAWKLSRVQVTDHLKEQVGDEMHGRAGHSLFSLRSFLVVGQLALSIALLTSAGLFAKGALSAARANPGFSFDKLALVETDAGLGGYDEAKGRQTYLGLVERLRALPGIEAATLGYVVPFGLFSDGCRVEKLAGGSEAGSATNSTAANKSVDVAFNIIGTDYFKTLGLSVLRGREFDAIEVSANSSSHVAIIDEPLARQLWPGEDPLGRNIKLSGKSGTVQIVGVVPGIRNDLTEKNPSSHVYVPFGQDYRSSVSLHLRLKSLSPEGEAAVLKSISDTIRVAEPDLPIVSIQTMRRFHEEGLLVWFIGTAARLFGGFGALALILAVVGVYGVNAYVVARRTREIGIRIALGATARDVVSNVLKQALVLASAGVGVGLLLAAGLGFVLRSVVYDSNAIDPLAFTIGPLCLVVAALFACYIPARRAATVHPMAALRYE